ncbi:hypothetical protein UM396_04145 [Geobacillus subterraneus]|uniref:hypothetical protein n=1 Tax=Geobacillus subterraneus TaxID=129338 RepID=UPI002AC926F3|nr:hypothetical protein [Geobacillus subterraneus]WPZ19119.1 hypothetical protein UM396_04145 [Geobacillus subterraneus]
MLGDTFILLEIRQQGLFLCLSEFYLAPRVNYGNYYHIDYGFIIKNLELGRLVMHIYHRLSSLDQGESIRIKELLDFEISIPDEDRKNELKKFIEREIFGMFDNIHTEKDLLMELKKRDDHLNDIPLRVKKYFGLEDADEC